MKNKIDLKIINTWMCPVENGAVRPCFGDISINNGIITACELRSFPEFKSIKDGIDTLDANGRVLTLPLVNFHEHSDRSNG
jgi:hypothetical protein